MEKPNDNETQQEEYSGPQPGTWAYTARIMADIFPDEDWDRWKDEMKDREMMEMDK